MSEDNSSSDSSDDYTKLSSCVPTENDVYRLSELSISEDKENMPRTRICLKISKDKKPSVCSEANKKSKLPNKNAVDLNSQNREYHNSHSHTRDILDAYFLQNDGKSGNRKTSNRTLAQLRVGKNPGLPDPQTYENLISNFKDPNSTIIKDLNSDLEKSLFHNWPIYLREGYNILLYGIGSKRMLLESFQKQYLKNANCIVIPGYDLSINIRQILNCICHEFLQISDTCRNPTDQLKSICQLFGKQEASKSPLYLLIHNIDGLGLRNAKTQAIFARLAAVDNIHIVASLDNMSTPILWSHNELANFSWIWEDCTNLSSYSEEASYANSSILQNILGGLVGTSDMVGSAGTMLASLRQVAASLTQNARDIFRLVAHYQLDAPSHEDKAALTGMPMEDLYWRCRDAFLTSNEATLRAQLTEFKDHKLVKIKKGPDGTELLSIPMDNATLRKLVENFDSFC